MSAEAEVVVGFLGQGEGEVKTRGEETRGWSTQRGWWPSPPVERTRRNGELKKVKDRRGEWQTKVASVLPEMGRQGEVIADVARFRPRMNREVSSPLCMMLYLV